MEPTTMVPFRLVFGALVFFGCLCQPMLALVAPEPGSSGSRRTFFRTIASASAASSVVFPVSLLSRAHPAVATTTDPANKLVLTDSELKDIVKKDILDKQFLVTGDITRSIYRPTATFTDEIDTYGLDQWVKGTQKLFVGSKSDVRLIGDVQVSPEKVEFRFDENLCFNIPFKPVVSLSGKVVLDRDESGFITAYREFWDQDVATVLKTAKF